MKISLIFSLVLTTIITMPLVKAGSPQQCKSTLVHVLHKYGMNLSDLTNEQKVIELKQRAQADGSWTQFAMICNSPTYQECDTCTCGYNPSLNACMWNCGCCWGNERCDSR